MRLFWVLALLLSLASATSFAPPEGRIHLPLPALSDSLLFEEKKSTLTTLTTAGHAAQVLAMGRSFLGLPYVSGTLDKGEGENLVVNLREIDCWTHVECSVALVLTGPQGSYRDYQEHLRKLRYWGGTIDGYGSRIHYFTGWLLQAEKLGILQNMTRDLGGIPYSKRVGYISARPQKYPKIKDEKVLATIKQSEKRINRHHWYYIPKARVSAKEHLLREGDLIILTSAKADLDVSHQGFAVRRNGRIHLLHASSLGGKVIISAQPLATYLAKQRGQSGIMVARMR